MQRIVEGCWIVDSSGRTETGQTTLTQCGDGSWYGRDGPLVIQQFIDDDSDCRVALVPDGTAPIFILSAEDVAWLEDYAPEAIERLPQVVLEAEIASIK